VNISEDTRKCVAFLGARRKGKFVPLATVFFVSYTQGQHQFNHIVTAEHVVSGILTKGEEMWMRANVVGGDTAEIPIPPHAFFFHPNADNEPTDVAVAPIGTGYVNQTSGETIQLDVRAFALNGENSFAPTEEFKEKHMGLGKEIVTVGLFRSHYGHNRNIPVIRVGNIAAKPEEPVFTKYTGYIDAYLVEARSIAGLSGSPVFAIIDSSLYFSSVLAARKELEGQKVALVGLMHGHFDVKNLNEDVITEDGSASVHTGMGVVVPTKKIIETLEHPDLIKARKDLVASLRSESGKTADLALDADPQASDENPTRREEAK
jgi:hypothetical protein